MKVANNAIGISLFASVILRETFLSESCRCLNGFLKRTLLVGGELENASRRLD